MPDAATGQGVGQRTSMWLDRFLPPSAQDDPEDRRHARLVVRLALGSALLNAGFAALFVGGLDVWRPGLVLALNSVVALGIPLLLRRTSTGFAGNALALVAFLSLGVTSFLRGGLVFPVFSWNLAIPLAAAIMGRSRTTVVWSLLIAVQGALLLAVGQPVAPSQYGIVSVFGLLGVIVTAGVVLDDRERQHVNEQRMLREELLNRQRLESIGLLAAGVAHDLNNVLTVIRTHAALGQEESEAGSTDDFGAIVDATDRGVQLTGSLLGLGKGKSSASSSDVTERIESLSRVFEVVLHSGVEVASLLEDGLPIAAMGPHHVEHVVVNLVVNAGDAMPDGGSIEVSTGHVIVTDPATVDVDIEPGEYVVIGVNDHGHGIAPDELKTIFEPSFTTKENGTGIGLASVRATLSAHGGGIHVS